MSGQETVGWEDVEENDVYHYRLGNGTMVAVEEKREDEIDIELVNGEIRTVERETFMEKAHLRV